MNDCAVLVCSCDKYEDAWKPFFTLLQTHWKDCPYPIYLNTETKKFSDPLNLGVKTINGNPKWQWSKRLRHCLEQIDSNYILLMLEDFFLLSDVKQKIVNECLDWMKKDDLAFVCFERHGHLLDGEVPEHEIFARRKQGTRYTLNLQVGIWNKKILLKCLKDFESPWEFEEIGNIRSYGIKQNFYIQLYDTPPIFDYNVNRLSGYGLYRGTWLKSNKSLFARYGIDVDFNRLGFFESEEQFVTYRRTPKEKLKFYFCHPIEIFKTIKAILFTVYKHIVWGLEKIKYLSKIRKAKTTK